MSSVQRIAALGGFAFGLAAFEFGPAWLGLDADWRVAWSALAHLGGPLLAAVFCALAAARSVDNERRAWRNFAIGSGIYLAGNTGYLVLTLTGQLPEFPSLAEAAFFVMAGFFAMGMLQFAQSRRRFGTVQVYNFVLIYCSVALSAVFVLNHNIAGSVMPPFATVVAFLYPALWVSVAAFGVVSLVLYARGRKAVPHGLIVLAVLAEAVADFRYALALMNGTYELGGLTQLLWVASAGLIVWGAIEQMAQARAPQAESAAPTLSGADRNLVQAAVPAAAVGAILLSGSLSGVVGGAPYSTVAALLAFVFSLVAGLREHWIISTQRRLRRDIEQSREELAANRKQLAAVLESTTDSVVVLDRQWNVVYFNRHAVATTSNPEALKIGASLWEMYPAALMSEEGDRYRRAVETGQPEEFEIFVEGRNVWHSIKAYPTDEGLSIFFRDISSQKAVRDEIEHMAHHDPLTGLANRTLFQKRLREAVQSKEPVSVLLLDLDHFKAVNDTMGHAVGDALLVSAAERLRTILGHGVTVGRLGGDEFAAILTGHDGKNEVAMIAMQLIEAVSKPHMITGQSVRVGASIGVALPHDMPGEPDDILKDADIALYAAKTEARGALRFFEPSMQIELMHKQALRTDLAGALERGEFALVFQPLVDLRANRVAGFEALLRWQHPKRGLVSPDQFVPLAEETGLIAPIGEWVLRRACGEAANWPGGISVAVNLSSRQFATDDLADVVEKALKDTGLAPERLELEITETVLMRDSDANLVTLRRLRDLGVHIALDDFGTGFSSLGYLQRFPFSKIKIDRSFISGLPNREESQAIVRSVMGLGKSLGLKVTAEGVETAAQLDWIRAGCDEAQGYYLSRPVAAAGVGLVIAEIDQADWARQLAG